MGDTLRTISPTDCHAQNQMDKLLKQEGIQRDRNLDYSCGLFDENEQLVATGNCFGNTIRCLAVASERQGEGLLNQIISHLIDIQAQRGNTHLFLYTKWKNTCFFKDLGFYEIARLDGQMVFMENRRDGFQQYCTNLKKKYVQAEQIAAVVMNANPFTLGHRYLIQQASKENDVVHLFLLSEEAGPIPYAIRRKLVEEGIADLPNIVIHESGSYIISSSTFPSYFLKDSDTVICTQAVLDLTIFSKIAQCLGIQRRYVGEETTSRVTTLYNEVMTAHLPEYGIQCCVIPRLQVDGKPISASTVRQAIHDGMLDAIQEMVPQSTYLYFTGVESQSVREAICQEKNVLHY